METVKNTQVKVNLAKEKVENALTALNEISLTEITGKMEKDLTHAKANLKIAIIDMGKCIDKLN